ncbi:hypothetical protein EWM64_g7016 [Hericium alpestre]|uniref:BRO1 domain-containing protein n=1 Tax=Hericium alpestre TaxID=135208 RepID=A0A4Y9ZQ12_9AGAM|nr:hypothetical protein EWM64_g7016 [Hericium alpestre]
MEVFSWRTTLSSQLFNNSPRLSLPKLPSELAFTLLTYGFALSNLARMSVVALGQYEYERGISDIERKAKDEKLGFAINLLCKASAVFAYVGDEILVEAEKTPGWLHGISRPPELSQEVASALSKMSLASSQSLAIRKHLTKAAFDSTVSPGPPLPKSHPSPSPRRQAAPRMRRGRFTVMGRVCISRPITQHGNLLKSRNLTRW